MLVESQERGIGVFCQWSHTDFLQHPGPFDALEQIVHHTVLLQLYLLHRRLADGRIFHQRHLLVVVEKQRVIPLSQKEALHLPLILLGQLRLPILRLAQREDYPLLLQLLVGHEIKDKVIKHGISRPWHRGLGNQQFQGVCLCHTCRVGNRISRHLLLEGCLLSRTGKHQQQHSESR